MSHDPGRVINRYEHKLAEMTVRHTNEIISLELQLEAAIAERNAAVKHAAELQERLNRPEAGAQ